MMWSAHEGASRSRYIIWLIPPAVLGAPLLREGIATTVRGRPAPRRIRKPEEIAVTVGSVRDNRNLPPRGNNDPKGFTT